jgi:hypothetical protein
MLLSFPFMDSFRFSGWPSFLLFQSLFASPIVHRFISFTLVLLFHLTDLIASVAHWTQLWCRWRRPACHCGVRATRAGHATHGGALFFSQLSHSTAAATILQVLYDVLGNGGRAAIVDHAGQVLSTTTRSATLSLLFRYVQRMGLSFFACLFFASFSIKPQSIVFFLSFLNRVGIGFRTNFRTGSFSM